MNWENEKVRNEVYKMMEWWLDKGIDGFRMDVINQISKDLKKWIKPLLMIRICMKLFLMDHEYMNFFKRCMIVFLAKYDTMTVGETADVSVEDALLYAGFDRRNLKMIFSVLNICRLDKRTKI